MSRTTAIILACSIAVSYLALVFVLFWISINLFTKSLETTEIGLKSLLCMAISVLTYAAIMSLYFVYIRKKEFVYLKSLYHVFILPVGIVFIILSMISVNLSAFTSIQELTFVVIILFGISAVTCFFIMRERHDSNLISATRVLLEYLDVFYWILFSVIVFIFDFSWKEVLQFFTIPFLIQTKITKAIIGHLKSGVIKKRSKVAVYISDHFLRIIDFKKNHKQKKIVKRKVRRIS